MSKSEIKDSKKKIIFCMKKFNSAKFLHPTVYFFCNFKLLTSLYDLFYFIFIYTLFNMGRFRLDRGMYVPNTLYTLKRLSFQLHLDKCNLSLKNILIEF
jgi:hypothetical protein